MAKTQDKTLEERWNEMTFGTYLAIQKVLENPKSEKSKGPFLNNSNAFRFLCELAFKRDDNGIGLTDIVKLGPGAINALEFLEPTGLVVYNNNPLYGHTKYTRKITLSPLGIIFMQAATDEVKKYLGIDLSSYARN